MYIYFFVYLIFPMVTCEAVLALLLPPLTNSLATMHIIKPITIVMCVPACILSLRLTVDIASWKWFFSLNVNFFFYVFVQTSNICECYFCFKPGWLEFNWKAGVSLAKKKRQTTYLHTYTLRIVNFVKPCINSVLFEYLNCCSAVWKSLKSKIVPSQYSRNLLTRLLFVFFLLFLLA